MAEVVGHQDEVGGFQGDVGAGAAQRDAQVGGGEGGGVVDAVADHGDDAVAAAQFLEQAQLVLGQQFGLVVQAERPGDGGGSETVVAGEQDLVGDAQVAEAGDGLPRPGAEGIGHGEHAQGVAVGGDEERGTAVVGPLLVLAGEIVRDGGALFGQQAGGADGDGPGADPGAEASAGQGLEIGGGLEGQAALAGGLDDGGSDGVLGSSLGGGGQ